MTSVKEAVGFTSATEIFGADLSDLNANLDDHVDEIMKRIFRRKLYSLMSHVVCNEAMLLNVLYWHCTHGSMHCPITGKPLVGYTLRDPPWVRNRLLEQIAEWWVTIVMTEGGQALQELPDFMYCPITNMPMDNVYTLTDGTSYSEAILKWLERNHTSPLTRLDTRLPTTDEPRTYIIRNRPVEAMFDIIRRARRLFLEGTPASGERKPKRKLDETLQ